MNGGLIDIWNGLSMNYWLTVCPRWPEAMWLTFEGGLFLFVIKNLLEKPPPYLSCLHLELLWQGRCRTSYTRHPSLTCNHFPNWSNRILQKEVTMLHVEDLWYSNVHSNLGRPLSGIWLVLKGSDLNISSLPNMIQLVHDLVISVSSSPACHTQELE